MRIIRLDEPEGNAYAIIGIARDMLRQIHGRGTEGEKVCEKYTNEAMAGDYENLKAVTKRYLPDLIDFAHADEVEVTETIVGRGQENNE